MSINLHLREGRRGPGVYLRQTPTHATHPIFDSQGGHPRGGHEAVRARYIAWVRSTGERYNENDQDIRQQAEHIADIEAINHPYFTIG